VASAHRPSFVLGGSHSRHRGKQHRDTYRYKASLRYLDHGHVPPFNGAALTHLRYFIGRR
jgi:hypothetical protein